MRQFDDDATRPPAPGPARARATLLVASVMAALLLGGIAPTVAAAPSSLSAAVVRPAAAPLTRTDALSAQRARQQRATAALARAVAAAQARALRSGTTRKARFNPGPFGSGLLGDYTSNAVIRRAGCLSAAPGRRVAIVGDSLTTRVRSALDVRMAEAGLPFCLNAQGGRPTRPTVNALLDLPRDSLDAIVVASGSNDIFNPLVLSREIDRVMAYAAGGPVYWVTVYVDRWATTTEIRRADQRNTAIVNSLLVRAAARHPNLVIVDWYGFLTRVYGRAATYLVDGVHTNNTGTDARALLLTRALLAHFGPPPPPPAEPPPPPAEPPATTTGDPSVTPTCDPSASCSPATTTGAPSGPTPGLPSTTTGSPSGLSTTTGPGPSPPR